jgi:hypothetical protein
MKTMILELVFASLNENCEAVLTPTNLGFAVLGKASVHVFLDYG